MIVVLTGAPGAGKGTQAELLSRTDSFRKLSTGDALRKHVKDGTQIGKMAGAVMERGQLVSDELLFDLVREELESIDGDRIVLLDGYPRNLAQAQALESLSSRHPVKAVILLDVPREELVSRLSGRRICGQCGSTFHITENPTRLDGICDRCSGQLIQRPDDNPASVAVRLDVYENATRPILDYYRKFGVVRSVSGIGTPEQIFTDLRREILRLKGE